MFWTVTLCLLSYIIGTIEVNAGRQYFPERPHVGHHWSRNQTWCRQRYWQMLLNERTIGLSIEIQTHDFTQHGKPWLPVRLLDHHMWHLAMGYRQGAPRYRAHIADCSNRRVLMHCVGRGHARNRFCTLASLTGSRWFEFSVDSPSFVYFKGKILFRTPHITGFTRS
jgi:hypothetical protein